MLDDTAVMETSLTLDDVKAIARLTIDLLDRLPTSLPLEERIEHVESMMDELAERSPDALLLG